MSGTARSVAAQVCQIVFGRMRTSESSDRHRYVERGFIHRPVVVWVGQSVLVLPPRDAAELGDRLRRLGVRVALGPVAISRSTLEAFRRRTERWLNMLSHGTGGIEFVPGASHP